MAFLGFAPEHLVDAMTEVARHLLALGARLYYGGDLRHDGFTEILMELALKHRRDADVGDLRPGIANVLAWPVYASTPVDAIDRTAAAFGRVAELRWLDAAGTPHSVSSPVSAELRPPDLREWAEGLTTMRRYVTQQTSARIVLGGRRANYRGRMPGVLEEALISLEAQQPLYVLGGFGGCAGDVASYLGLPAPGVTPARDGDQEWRAAFAPFSAPDLRNGLLLEENRAMASTAHVDQAVALLLRGLTRVAADRP